MRHEPPPRQIGAQAPPATPPPLRPGRPLPPPVPAELRQVPPGQDRGGGLARGRGQPHAAGPHHMRGASLTRK